VWQSLYRSTQGSTQGSTQERDFIVIAIALDQPEAARPWIEAAAPTYPCLIDRDHRVAELYTLVNVPQAVWIDESGRMVRPPETAGSTDGFRRMDRKTFTMPAEALAERQRVKERYVAAVKDWAERGAASPYALDAAGVMQRLRVPDASVAEAHARFRLAQTLQREGRADEARAQFDEATRLHPDSWAMWRQSADKDKRGLASGAEFWARVDALGDRPYYLPVEIATMPKRDRTD
jgi:Tetratricopeptide repeat/AhpC/TSA family